MDSATGTARQATQLNSSSPSSTAGPITIPYSLLLSPTSSLAPLLSTAFSSSPTSLGLLLISDLPPAFPALRRQLLLLSNAFASLPEASREKYADASSKWSFGWSCGKEIMNGKQDYLKGSYYNNPSEDDSNIWPSEEDCPGFKDSFQELCGMMVEIGVLVARACDGFVGEGEGLVGGKTVEALVAGSSASKARLLHYFAPEGQLLNLSAPLASSEEKIDDSWCGTHIDHSILTALCPALYLFQPTTVPGQPPLAALIIPSPSTSTGLYIKTRAGETVKGSIPENCMAFQTGETLELLSDNALAATPHFVNSSASTLGLEARKVIEEKKRTDPAWREVESGTVTRETLAVFLQPNNEEVVSKTGETFGAFGARVLSRHY